VRKFTQVNTVIYQSQYQTGTETLFIDINKHAALNNFSLIDFAEIWIYFAREQDDVPTHIVNRRMVVNFLQVDIVDSDAFFNLFLEELRRVILQPNAARSTRYSLHSQRQTTSNDKATQWSPSVSQDWINPGPLQSVMK